VTLAELKALFASTGCRRLYAKSLAENDNSKNQVYFGPGFQALNLFPNSGVVADNSRKNAIFKAKLRFGWLLSTGAVVEAPGAQLILYPQYPEVRFSGYLRGCASGPSELMSRRQTGRILFLGVKEERELIGFVVGPDSQIAAEFLAAFAQPTIGVFSEIPLPNVPSGVESRNKLISELHRISRLGWIDSKQLDSGGQLKPCAAPQCGGFTLEAELGIAKNSAAEPDFLGWEVKQHSVADFDHVEAGVITLMTPEPTGGYYRTHGVEAFVRKFGYADKMGRADRLNFGGVHRAEERHNTTHLTMKIKGYDRERTLITDTAGYIALVSDDGEVAASWAFSGLFEHWSRKHMKAAYVPSQCRKVPIQQYCYGPKVRLAEGTDSLRLLKAVATGAVYYDPGIKVERASSAKPLRKRRSQFRVASKSIGALYEKVELVSV
jgi:MvaI/BcnI restriction endonuclease family